MERKVTKSDPSLKKGLSIRLSSLRAVPFDWSLSLPGSISLFLFALCHPILGNSLDREVASHLPRIKDTRPTFINHLVGISLLKVKRASL